MNKITLLYDFLLEEGGLERVMITQTKHLSKDHHVTASFATINARLRTLFPENVTLTEHDGTFNNNTLKIIHSFLNINSLKKYKDTRLFISHSFICTRLANWMKKKYKIPYAVFLHHPPNFLYFKGDIKEWGYDTGRKVAMATGITFGPLLRAIDRRVVREADKVFVNSYYTKRRIEKIYGIDATVIYPTLPHKNFSIKKEKDTDYIFNKYNLKKYIFCTGRLIPDKKYEWLVKALPFIQDKEIELVISGRINKDYEYFIRNIAIKNGTMHRIKFLGFVPDEDLIALFNRAELFAYPSPEEDFGMVPVEAMACGCPVVAWGDNAGPSETVIHSVNGYLAHPYDLQDFATKIQQTLDEDFKTKHKKEISKTVEKFKEENQIPTLLKEIESIKNKNIL